MAEINIYLYFALCFGITVLGAWLFEALIGKAWKAVSSPKKVAAVNKC